MKVWRLTLSRSIQSVSVIPTRDDAFWPVALLTGLTMLTAGPVLSGAAWCGRIALGAAWSFDISTTLPSGAAMSSLRSDSPEVPRPTMLNELMFTLMKLVSSPMSACPSWKVAYAGRSMPPTAPSFVKAAGLERSHTWTW
jgi:hypothetical protein